ncbi:MAG: class I SAM-dependent methyltransferase [Parachlamydiales bacterium]
MSYRLIDSGEGEKLEQFGPYLLARPCAQAVWKKQFPEKWSKADAHFTREEKKGWRGRLPDEWTVEAEGLTFRLHTTDFGHLGLFPEQIPTFRWLQQTIKPPFRLLNLFAYSGGVTLAAAKAGAEVCHLDASKGMVSWARENAALSHLEEAPIRWIVDDVMKFLKREKRRGRVYDGIVLDPPSYGRGAQGEVFKIDEQIVPLLEQCADLLSDTPRFVHLSCHTPGYTPLVLSHLLSQVLPKGELSSGELVLEGESLSVPMGAYAKWEPL